VRKKKESKKVEKTLPIFNERPYMPLVSNMKTKQNFVIRTSVIIRKLHCPKKGRNRKSSVSFHIKRVSIFSSNVLDGKMSFMFSFPRSSCSVFRREEKKKLNFFLLTFLCTDTLKAMLGHAQRERKI
jgi:hypothetical protein